MPKDTIWNWFFAKLCGYNTGSFCELGDFINAWMIHSYMLSGLTYKKPLESLQNYFSGAFRKLQLNKYKEMSLDSRHSTVYEIIT